MTYTHLTTDELVIIESYFKNNQSVAKTAQCLGRAWQTIHNVYQFLKTGATILNYYQQYKENKNAAVDARLLYQRNKKNMFKRGLFKGGHRMWLSAARKWNLIVQSVHCIECFKLAHLMCVICLWKANENQMDTKKTWETSFSAQYTWAHQGASRIWKRVWPSWRRHYCRSKTQKCCYYIGGTFVKSDYYIEASR